MPTRRLTEGVWPHPARLPLGSGWYGLCSAPGHEATEPTVQELTDHCNLGYASACQRLPQERSCDAVRFCIARDQGSRLTVQFSCESAHRPTGHGTLEFDAATASWVSPHADVRIQKMAECYVESYVSRKISPAPAGVSSDES